MQRHEKASVIDANIRAGMRYAHGIAKQSLARRRKVGCAIISKHGEIRTGVNHNPYDIMRRCDFLNDAGELESYPTVVHAEVDAILFAKRDGIFLPGSIVCVTCSPCYDCAVFMAIHGIAEVIYLESYRTRDGLDFLDRTNIPHRRYRDLSSNKNDGRHRCGN